MTENIKKPEQNKITHKKTMHTHTHAYSTSEKKKEVFEQYLNFNPTTYRRTVVM